LPPIEDRWVVNGVYNSSMKTKGEMFVWYTPVARLQTGFAYLTGVDALRLLVAYEAKRQHGLSPSLSLGTGLQEVGTAKSAAFGTAGWTLTRWVGIPASIYVGAAHRISPWPASRGGNFIRLFGAAAHPSRWFSTTLQYDGHNWHGTASLQTSGFRIGVFLLRMDSPGLLVAYRR
jgi:hypothetical protein